MKLSTYTELIRHRLTKENQNYLLVICGQTGSGKSWRALRLKEMIDPKTGKNYKTHIVFTAEQFMDIADGGIGRGDIVVWDEMGIDEGANNKEWYSVQNKCVNYMLQTVRHQNYGIIFTLPTLADLDSGVLRLLHGYMQCLHIDPRLDAVKCAYKTFQHNPLYKKTYYKHRRAKLGGMTKKLYTWYISPPQNQTILNWYEEKHKKFKMDKVKEWKQKILEDKEKKAKDWSKVDSVEILSKPILDHPNFPYNVISENYGKKYVDKFKIQNILSVGLGKANRVKKYVTQYCKEQL